MPAVIACPDAETLRQLAVGDTPEPLSAVLVSHLQSCPKCAGVYDGLVDPLVDLLRRPGLTPSSEDAMEEIAGRAKRLFEPAPSTVPESAGVDELLPATVDRAGSVPPAEATRTYSPKRLGKFLLHSELGSGGMGVVFRARDTLLNREVALKLIRLGGTAPMSAAQRGRFLREARAAAGLRHENVITVFEVGEVEGTPYLVMPLLDGETLADRLKRDERLPESEVCRLAAQVADGLAAAHAANLIHRDVKPSNIWVEPRRGGWVQLLDFGLVKPLDEPGEHLTASYGLAGTPPYMSPEQADAGAIDHRSDLFSLGCVVYEMTTGRPLFRNAPGLPPVLHQVRNFKPPTVASLPRGVHPGLAAVIVALLQPAPAARIPTAAEAARRLREVRHDAPPPTAQSRVPVANSARRPRRKVLFALGLFFFAALFVVAFQIVVRVKKDEADPGVVLTVPKGADVVLDGDGNATVTLPPKPAPPVAAPTVKPARGPDPAGVSLDSAAYLPFDPGTSREVTDYLEVHGKTPEEVVAWGAALPAGYVPIVLGRHASGANPAPTHAVAVKLAKDAPAVAIQLAKWDVNPIPGNWPLHRVTFVDPKGGWLTLQISTPDDSHRYFYTTAVAQFPAKVAEMRARRYRPNALTPNPYADHAYTGSQWVPDGGRDKWVVKPDCTAEELDEFVVECVRTGQYVGAASAFMNEKQELRFAVAGLENADGRDWNFLRDLGAADYETELARHKADGFTPVSVTSYGDVKEPLYAVAWLRFRPRAKTEFDGLPWDKIAVALPGVEAAHPLDATAYLPLDEGTKRGVTDFSVVLDAPPEAVVRWARTLPADYVPIALGAHASARPLQAHAVAVKLTNAPPPSRPVWSRERLPEFLYEARPGVGWRTIQRLPFETPEQGSETLYFASQDLTRHSYGWGHETDWPAKAKAMREVQKCKPYIVNASPFRTGYTLHYYMDQFGRDKWRVEGGVTRDKLQALADTCVKQHLYVSLVTAYLDAPGNLRFGLIAWENPDGRDTAFVTEMTKAELLKELADRKGRGFCPVSLTSFGDPTNPRYAAAWIRYDAKK